MLASALLSAGAILLAQGVALYAYQNGTGRSHELPVGLARLVGLVASGVGIDSAFDSGNVALYSMRKLHRVGATWDLLFRSGHSMLSGRCDGMDHVPAPGKRNQGAALAGPGSLPHLYSAQPYSPGSHSRGLMMALLIHRTLRVDYDAPLILMDQFRNLGIMLGLLAVPVALAWRQNLADRAEESGGELTRLPAVAPPWRRWTAAGAALAGILILVFAGFWDPPGIRGKGRVLVDEFHSKWEPTQRPYDTEWYGNDSGYNYAVIYDYLNHFIPWAGFPRPSTLNSSTDCDVLICKVPTERYCTRRGRAIERFVRQRRRQLLLVGEHTDVFGTGVSLNDISSGLASPFAMT